MDEKLFLRFLTRENLQYSQCFIDRLANVLTQNKNILIHLWKPLVDMLDLYFIWAKFRLSDFTVQVCQHIHFLRLYLLLNLFIYRNTKEENNTPLPPPASLSYFPIPSAVGGRPCPPAGPIRRVLIWVCCLSVSHCSQIGRRAAEPPNTQTPHTEDADAGPDSTYNVITWRVGHLSNLWTVSLSAFLQFSFAYRKFPCTSGAAAHTAQLGALGFCVCLLPASTS